MSSDSGGQTDTLCDRITALRPSTRVAFSTALWRERGWTVEREVGDEWTELAVESPDGKRDRRLFLPVVTPEKLASTNTPALPPLGDGDRIVWPVDAGESDESPFDILAAVDSARVLDTADLAERYRYALDSAAQARIADGVFDTDVETLLDRPERTVESPEDTPLAADARTAERSEATETAPTADRTASDGTDPADTDVASADSPAGGASGAGHAGGADDVVRGGDDSGAARSTASDDDSTASDDDSTASGRDTTTASHGHDDGNTGHGRRRQSRVALGGTLALALLLVGAAAIGVGPLAPALADAIGEEEDFGSGTVWAWQYASQERSGTADDTALDTGPDRVSTAVPSKQAEQSVLPPGVTSDGELNPSVVASETERVLSNTSYRFVLTYRERVRGNTTARWREVATVENNTQFSSEVSLLGTPTELPGYIDRTPQYADGDQYAEYGETTAVENRRVSTEDPFLPRILQYIDWFLTVRETRLLGTEERGGESTTLIGLRDDPWPGVENTTGFAVVSERGVIRAIHRSYNPPGQPEVTITVTVRVTDIGETTVDRPRWLREQTSTANDTANSTATATETPA